MFVVALSAEMKALVCAHHNLWFDSLHEYK